LNLRDKLRLKIKNLGSFSPRFKFFNRLQIPNSGNTNRVRFFERRFGEDERFFCRGGLHPPTNADVAQAHEPGPLIAMKKHGRPEKDQFKHDDTTNTTKKLLYFEKKKKKLRSVRSVVVVRSSFFRPPCRNDALSKNPSSSRCHPRAADMVRQISQGHAFQNSVKGYALVWSRTMPWGAASTLAAFEDDA